MAVGKYVAVLTIVNQGFSDKVMEAAKEVGARGGTILRARGSAANDIEDKYGVVITPEKEVVIILVQNKIKEEVMTAINKNAGLETHGMGIVFAIPVDHVVGLKFEN